MYSTELREGVTCVCLELREGVTCICLELREGVTCVCLELREGVTCVQYSAKRGYHVLMNTLLLLRETPLLLSYDLNTDDPST